MTAPRHRPPRHRRRSWLLTIGAILLGVTLPFLAPALASAHAYPVSATVMPNASLKTAPSSITITFAEDVNPSGSDIVVYDATGKVVSTGAQVNRDNLKQMTVQMRADGSEVYLVQWHTISADDGDADIGGYTFLVNPSAATKTDTSANFGGSSTSASGTSSSGGVPAWALVGVGIAGLIIGAAATAAAQRRR